MNWDLVVIFAGVVSIIAVRGHYGRLAKTGGAAGSLTAADQAAINAAADAARRLESRLDALERVLDEDVPGWRARMR